MQTDYSSLPTVHLHKLEIFGTPLVMDRQAAELKLEQYFNAIGASSKSLQK